MSCGGVISVAPGLRPPELRHLVVESHATSIAILYLNHVTAAALLALELL
jgi:hypothetical protein